jgi:hypothetical protein
MASCDVSEFVALLSRAEPGTFVLQSAVYPREAQARPLQKQGQAVARMVERAKQRVPTVSVFRILWSHLAFIAAPENADEIKRAVLEAATSVSSTEVEVRGAWCTLDGPRSERWIDEFFGELSAYRNFGSVASIEGRMIDGVEVNSSDPNVPPARAWKRPR